MSESKKLNHHILAETNWKFVKDTDYQLAILPWGATEAHNYHLPYSTDNIQCSYIAEQAAKRIWREGYRPIVLPCIPFGVQSAQIKVKFNINMKPSTQFMVLKDIVESLEAQGIKRLVVLNGHGGNSFIQMARELYTQTKVMIFIINWYDSVNKNLYFEEPGDHAGEMETSVMKFVAPNLVLSLSEAGNGKAKTIKVNSIKEGWIWTQRGWLGEVTEDTGIGNPLKSDPKKGEKYISDVISKISNALKEIADLKEDDIYE